MPAKARIAPGMRISSRPCRFPRRSIDYPDKASEETTMRYLCLVYCQDSTFAAMTPDEKHALDRDSLAFDRELERRGQFVAADAL